MAEKLMCKVLGHRVNRKKVRRDGEVFVGKCRWCRARMTKSESGWSVRTSP